ncbi:MAG: SRPBCC domain-containing protein [Acidobacteriota bacterium]
MAVKKDKDGRRSVEAKVEVPGSPEEVWQAIATGRGISSWFVPSQVEERVGGTAVTTFGPGMDSVAKISEWTPPRSFAAETEEEPGTVATEWHVEAREGGTCVVRVVHRWFADSDDWDGQFEGHVFGWEASYFRFLRLYLKHFSGQRCSPLQLSAITGRSAPEALRALRGALNIEGPGRFQSSAGTPDLGGVVERVEITDPELLRIRERSPHIVAAREAMEGENPELFLRLDRPAPGLAHGMVMAMGEQTLVSIRIHFYGEAGAKVAPMAEGEWSEWFSERFPAPE